MGDDGPGRNTKVLIVDDDPEIVKVIRYTMETNGFKTINTLHGAEVTDLIRDEKPNVVLLDIMMKDMDGYEVLRRIRASEDIKDTIVIFVSAKASSDDIETGLEMGADGYLVKPFAIKSLVECIEEAIQKKESGKL